MIKNNVTYENVELTIRVKILEQTVEILTKSLAQLNYQLATLPADLAVQIQKHFEEIESEFDVDDEDKSAKIFKIVRDDEESEDE